MSAKREWFIHLWLAKYSDILSNKPLPARIYFDFYKQKD